MAWRRLGDKPSSKQKMVYWRIYASLDLSKLISNRLRIPPTEKSQQKK